MCSHHWSFEPDIIGTETWNIVSGYAPQVGCSDQEKEVFWTEFNSIISGVPTDEVLSIGMDGNGHVG